MMEKTNSLAYFPDQGESRDRVSAGEFIVLNDRACPAVQPGFRIRIFFYGSGSGQKSSCGSGSLGYPGEGAGGKGKK